MARDSLRVCKAQCWRVMSRMSACVLRRTLDVAVGATPGSDVSVGGKGQACFSSIVRLGWPGLGILGVKAGLNGQPASCCATFCNPQR